tara:strand:+ start:1287 stop:1712 length:426 start_codon:yes stop_codon:yes gene_type:complete
MANRVLLGNRGGQYGLFVSKANKDVTNTSLHEDDLIFSTSGSVDEYLQFTPIGNTSSSTTDDTATITGVGASATPTISVPDLDFQKLVIFQTEGTGYVPLATSTGGATSTTVTKPATFSNGGITNTNQSSNYKFAAIGDIF